MIAVAGYPTIAAAVQSLSTADMRPSEIAAHLGISKEQVYGALYRTPSRPKVTPAQQAIRAKLLPMLSGPGERHDDCRSYPACLKGAATVTSGDAHCPEVCANYARTKPDPVEPRESWEGWTF